jgi:ribonuclease P/MRP protein subunit POP1
MSWHDDVHGDGDRQAQPAEGARGASRPACFAAVAAMREPRGRQGGYAGGGGFGARSLDVVDFAGARVSELRALRAAASSTSGNRRVYQSLGWHQRRRTMSHTSHRMPARLRAAHRRELALSAAPGTPMAADGVGIVERPPGPQGKMRCRKYRRKASYLLAIRKVRSQSPRWLETHIWHAKRFSMETVAGGRTVAVASNDRGLRSGYRAVAKTSLIHDASYLDVVELTAPTRAALVAALAACLSPEDTGRCTVDPVRLGLRRVERVVVLHPETGRAVAPVDVLWRPQASESGHLWMWCHPAGSASVASALEAVGDAGLSATVLNASTNLLTFSLIGPRASAVLNAVLHRVRGGGAEWEAVRSVRSAASLPQGCVLAFDVEDPRASFPPKRTGESGNLTTSDHQRLRNVLSNGFRHVKNSQLWNPDTRAEATGNAKHADGTPWKDVPVMLLQRASASGKPGCKGGQEFASGWDLIVPSGWGMAFWISLMYANGARAAGQRELRHVALETGSSVFPEDYQDTDAGAAAMLAEEERLQCRFDRRPKAKRVNYIKYRIASPFRVDFDTLVTSAGSLGNPKPAQANGASASNRRRPSKRPRAEIAMDVAANEAGFENAGGDEAAAAPREAPRVIRSERQICAVLQIPPPARCGRDAVRVGAETAAGKGGPESLLSSFRYLFVRVYLQPCSRGAPVRNAVIALPDADDRYDSSDANKDPVEPRARHSNCEPTRRVVGQVVHGDYLLGKGMSAASGVMAVAGVRAAALVAGGKRKGGNGSLPSLLDVRVLFRNTDSLQYRWAVASVMMG